MSRRTERVSEAIREVASRAILFEMKDPRVTGVTVTRAEVTGDLRHAKVFVSLMGTESERKLTLRGLDSARGFLQRKVADRLETRYTPHIEIVEDESVKKSLEISRLLKEVLPESEDSTTADPEDQAASGESSLSESPGGIEENRADRASDGSVER